LTRKWKQAPVPTEVASRVQPGTRLFYCAVEDGQLRVLVSPPFGGAGWHLSISHVTPFVGPSGKPFPGRYPTWDEIRDARYDLMPDKITAAMLLPPKAEYVNIHPTTFHLHQIEED